MMSKNKNKSKKTDETKAVEKTAENETKSSTFNVNSLTVVLVVCAFLIGALIGYIVPSGEIAPTICPEVNADTGNNVCLDTDGKPVLDEMSTEAVSLKVKNFLDNSDQLFSADSLLDNNMEINITKIEKHRDIFYKLDFDILKDEEIQGSLSAFTSLDGKSIFFSEPQDIDEIIEYVAPPTPEPVDVEELKCDNMEKVEETKLEAFVVSYCPFGIQLQRMALELPEDLIDNVVIRYIGAVVDGKITSMHGDQEAVENHRQICLREEQSEKFYEYLSCFIKEGNTESCLTETAVDTDMLTACMEDPARGIAYAEVDFALQNEQGVSGSPTLILNGVKLSEYDSSIALEKTMRSTSHMQAVLCCSSTVEEEGCTAKVPIEKAADSFNPTYLKEGGEPATGSC